MLVVEVLLGLAPLRPKPLRPRTRRTSEVKRKLSRRGKRSSRLSSFGSPTQPSMGMPFAAQHREQMSLDMHKRIKTAHLGSKHTLQANCQRDRAWTCLWR